MGKDRGHTITTGAAATVAKGYHDRICALIRAIDPLLDSARSVRRLGGCCAFLGTFGLV